MIVKAKDPTITKKEFRFDIKSEKEAGEDGMFRFEAFGSTFGNIDLVDDVMVKGCFTESLKSITPVILWQHDRFEPIGMPESIFEDEKGLRVTVVMPSEDDFVRGRVMPQLRIGSIKSMSIGFMVQEFEIKNGIRFITKALLKEISLVTFPANPEAMVTSVKSLDDAKFAPRTYEWNEKEAIVRLLEAKATFAHVLDSESQPVFALADVIDGAVQIVPAALIAAKKALCSEDSPLNLQAEEKARITANIELHIKKLNEEQPINMLSISAVNQLSKKELEAVLRESGAFSKDAAVAVASGFQKAGDPPTTDEATLKALEAYNAAHEEKAILAKIESLTIK